MEFNEEILTAGNWNELRKRMETYGDIKEAVKGKDIICTDSLSADILRDFENYQITKEIMDMANKNAVLNPCPPFYRGEEVSADVIHSDYFVGYQFKKYLLEVQQAIMIYCLTDQPYSVIGVADGPISVFIAGKL